MESITPKSPLKVKRFNSKINTNTSLASSLISPLLSHIATKPSDEISTYHLSEQTKQKEKCVSLQSHINLILNNMEDKDKRSCEQKVADSKDYPDKDILYQRINKLNVDINKNEVYNLIFEQILNNPIVYGFPIPLINLFLQISQYYKDIIDQIPMIIEDVNQRLKYEMAETHLDNIKKEMSLYPSNRLREINELLDKEKERTDTYATDLANMRSKLAEFRAPAEITLNNDIKYSDESLSDGTPITVQHIKAGDNVTGSISNLSNYYTFEVAEGEPGVQLWLQSTCDVVQNIEISLKRLFLPFGTSRSHFYMILHDGFEELTYRDLRPGTWFMQFKGVGYIKKSYSFEFRSCFNLTNSNNQGHVIEDIGEEDNSFEEINNLLNAGTIIPKPESCSISTQVDFDNRPKELYFNNKGVLSITLLGDFDKIMKHPEPDIKMLRILSIPVLTDIIKQLYTKKILDDNRIKENNKFTSDVVPFRNHTLCELLYDQFMTKYGLSTLAEYYIVEFLISLRTNWENNVFLEDFAKFVGVVIPSYQPIDFDFYIFSYEVFLVTSMSKSNLSVDYLWDFITNVFTHADDAFCSQLYAKIMEKCQDKFIHIYSLLHVCLSAWKQSDEIDAYGTANMFRLLDIGSKGYLNYCDFLLCINNSRFQYSSIDCLLIYLQGVEASNNGFSVINREYCVADSLGDSFAICDSGVSLLNKLGLNDAKELKNIFKQLFHQFFMKEIQRMSNDSFSSDAIKDLSSYLATLSYNIDYSNLYETIHEHILNFVTKFNMLCLNRPVVSSFEIKKRSADVNTPGVKEKTRRLSLFVDPSSINNSLPYSNSNIPKITYQLMGLDVGAITHLQVNSDVEDYGDYFKKKAALKSPKHKLNISFKDKGNKPRVNKTNSTTLREKTNLTLPYIHPINSHKTNLSISITSPTDCISPLLSAKSTPKTFVSVDNSHSNDKKKPLITAISNNLMASPRSYPSLSSSKNSAVKLRKDSNVMIANIHNDISDIYSNPNIQNFNDQMDDDYEVSNNKLVLKFPEDNSIKLGSLPDALRIDSSRYTTALNLVNSISQSKHILGLKDVNNDVPKDMLNIERKPEEDVDTLEKRLKGLQEKNLEASFKNMFLNDN